ncbi:hypothetical protein PF006_g8975 [Phytophthora fragariae]|uniref:Uncharacterized protein n=1 Tax=Phytophthora fragariae TaxID=53985 RepID=A0A6A3U4Z9_9STRA|nr:hypothetical protein PF006_g8975 [Phytophthora fragariae]
MRKPIANEGLVFMEEQRQQLGLLPVAVTRTKFANKGLDFTEERRQHLGLRDLLPSTLYDTRSDRILSSETEEVLQLELASYIKSAASQRANSSAIRTQDKRLSQPGARVVQEELENGQIAIVEDELRDQGDRIHRCVVISLVKYAVIALTKYGVFTTLTLHSTGYKYAVIALTMYDPHVALHGVELGGRRLVYQEMCDHMKITSSSYKSSQGKLRKFDSVRGLIAGLVLPAVRWYHGFLLYPVLYL